MTDLTDFADQRRKLRQQTTATKPKRNSLAALAKAWHVDQDRLSKIILDIALQKGLTSNQGENNG